MSKNTELQGNLALDNSVLVEYFVGSSYGELVRDYFNNLGTDERVNISLYTISELFYILCRINGPSFASGKVRNLVSTSAVQVHSSLELALHSGELKCQRAISLGDCSAIAVGEISRCPVVFMREKELERELSKSEFKTRIIFLN